MKSLFENVSEKEIDKILKILDSKPIILSKKSIITLSDDNYNIGIILKGEANIEKYDYDGNRSILEKLHENSIFGKYFYPMGKDISVVSISECEVLLLEYDSIINKVKNKVFLNNFYYLLSQKIIEKNIRLEILSKRSIKDKLLSYFFILAQENSKQVFILPFNYTELADYLFVDRSAMMREIKKMKESKIIKTNGKIVKLLN